MEPFYSMRLGDRQQNDAGNLSEFLAIFRRNQGSCDEVWYSTLYGFPTLERHKEVATRCVESAEQVRRQGIVVSLQISNTIGHGSYNRVQDFSGFAWDDMVGADGTHAVYCCCPRDPRLLSYLTESTQYYAALKPAYVWIDDDLRIHHHHPVDYGCFCDRCIDEYNRRHGTRHDREGLVSAINSAGSAETRKRWVRFNQDSSLGVASAVCRGVMEVSPQSVVGVQQASFAWNSYTGGEFDALYGGIKRLTGKPSACRPGGGYYNDHAPRAVLDKALNLCLQTLRMPADMRVSKAEVENIPHNVSGKSVWGTLVESAVYLAYGCTSLSYSAFMIPNEKPAFYEPLMRSLADWRPFLTRYAQTNAGTVNGGAGIAFSRTPYTMNMEGREPFAWATFRRNDVLALVTCGLPVTWQDANPPIHLLHPEAVDRFTDNELLAIFGKGVLTDGQTVEKLNARGLGHILGLDVETFEELNSIDMLNDHPINLPYAGQSWYHFYTVHSPYPPLKLLTIRNPEAEVIGTYVRRGREELETGVSAVLTETPMGGRAAVFGYNLWTNLVNSGKRHQILNAADWASGGRMPVYVETPSQVVAVPRVDSQGKLVSVMLVNASIDSSPRLTIHVRGCRGTDTWWVVPDADARRVETDGEGKADRTVVVDSLGPWSLGVIETA